MLSEPAASVRPVPTDLRVPRPERPWSGVEVPPATGLGSMPGTDALEAARIVVGECPDLPFVARLPARGPQSGAVARTAGLLVGLPVDAQPAGWRLVDHPGRDAERIAADLSADLDALEEVLDGYRGPLKLDVVGPLSLSAELAKNRGDLALADHGIRREIVQSLAEGLAQQVSGLRRRVPGAQPIVALDEPRLAAVLAGDVPTASGFGRLRAVEQAEARESWRSIVDAVGPEVAVLVRLPAALVVDGDPNASAAAPDVLGAVRDSGVSALLFAPAAVPRRSYDAFAELVEAGVDLGLGVVAAGVATNPDVTRQDRAARTAADFWSALGFAAADSVGRLLLTPVEELAGVSARTARDVLRRTREVGPVLAELLSDRS